MKKESSLPNYHPNDVESWRKHIHSKCDELRVQDKGTGNYNTFDKEMSKRYKFRLRMNSSITMAKRKDGNLRKILLQIAQAERKQFDESLRRAEFKALSEGNQEELKMIEIEKLHFGKNFVPKKFFTVYDHFARCFSAFLTHTYKAIS